MKIGVLALQGNIAEHIKILKDLKVQTYYVSQPQDLIGIDGLIIPGGESTTISKLLKQSRLHLAIKKKHREGMNVFGTCAGAIIASKKIFNEKNVSPLGLIDIEIQRNAFGGQLDSFEAKLESLELGKIDAAFIRAPSIKKTGKSVKVLCNFQNKPVLVEGNRVLASTFHTELDSTAILHKLFLNQVSGKKINDC